MNWKKKEDKTNEEIVRDLRQYFDELEDQYVLNIKSEWVRKEEVLVALKKVLGVH